MENTKIDWPVFKARVLEALTALPHFLRHPIRGMRTLPDWPWLEILTLQALFAGLCGFFTGAVVHNPAAMIVGLVLGPLVDVPVTAISTGILFYALQFFFRREVSYRQLYTNIAFAMVPAKLVMILTPLAPIIAPVGTVATLALLYVGLVNNFSLSRVQARNVVLAILGLYLAFWGWSILGNRHHHEYLRERATPESLDILEHEMDGE